MNAVFPLALAATVLAPVAVRIDAPASSIGSATLARAEVDVPFTTSDPLPTLYVRVNGRRARVLIDTGGRGLDLSPAFAQRIGIATRAAGAGVFAGGLRGDVRAGRVERLDIGGATLRSLAIHVPPAMPPGVDGVIGTNVLARFIATIDYRLHRLVLRPNSASPMVEAQARSEHAVVIPMLLLRNHFIFARARIGRAREALFNVDTGGPGVGVDLTQSELRASGIVPDASHPSVMLGGGGAVKVLPFYADVTLGQRTFRRVRGIYLPDDRRPQPFPFPVAGKLSQELFNRGALTFDFAAMRLIFEAP